MSLYLFDVDGTIVVSFLRQGAGNDAYDQVEVLPGRLEKLAELREAGHSVALVTNQGGVAMGYQDPGQVIQKMTKVVEACGLWGEPDRRICWAPTVAVGGARGVEVEPERRTKPWVYVSFGHPKPKVPGWLDSSDWRKPGGGMIREAMSDHGFGPATTTFVGDMDSDRQAALAAGVRYVDAEEFFWRDG